MRGVVYSAGILGVLTLMIYLFARWLARYFKPVEEKDFAADSAALAFPQHNPGLTVGEVPTSISQYIDEHERLDGYDAIASARQST